MSAGRCAAGLLLLAASARGDVLHVPQEFATIQAAVDAVGKGEHTILIAAGSYAEQVIVTGADGLTLRGQGQVELTGESGVGLLLDTCVNVTAERLRFRGQDVGVRVTGCTGVTLERCRAEDMAGQGFQVLGSAGTLLERCLVDGALNHGLQLVTVLGGAVRRCTFRNVLTGIAASDAQGLEVDRPRIEHTTSDGLVLDAGCRGVDVHHARLVDTGGTAIVVEGTDNRFGHDRIVEPAENGFLFTATSARNVLNHERVIGGTNAFFLGGEAQEALACRAIGPTVFGFGCSDAGSHLVQGCRSTSPGASSYFINSNSPGCELLDNRSAHAGADGFSTIADSTVFSGNVATDSLTHGFRIQSSLNILTGNRAHGSGQLDLLDIEGGSTYLDNDFGTESLP